MIIDLLNDLVADEPAYDLRPDLAIRDGRRRRTQRRAAVAGATLTLAAALAGAAVLVTGPATADRLHVAGATPPAPVASPVGDAARQAYLDRVRRLEAAVRESLPAGLTMTNVRSDSAEWPRSTLDQVIAQGQTHLGADLDDGSGAGQLQVDLVLPGTTTIDDPGDPDGSSVSCPGDHGCTVVLADGLRAVVRPTVLGSGGSTTTAIDLVRPDGSGIGISTSNATFPAGQAYEDAFPGRSHAVEDFVSGLPTVNRPAPVLTDEQLIALALAIDGRS